jgi:hypothetical protein
MEAECTEEGIPKVEAHVYFPDGKICQEAAGKCVL